METILKGPVREPRPRANFAAYRPAARFVDRRCPTPSPHIGLAVQRDTQDPNRGSYQKVYT
jgi:hypothetical protein